MKRLEQQVDPKLGTPAGLYPQAAPIHVNTPPIAPVVDPRQVDGALRNLAGLTAQLGNLRKEADDEADELAMAEFNGYRIKREREMLAEFAELDINDQSDEAIRSMSESFGAALDDYAKGLPFSDRRREVVNSLVRSYQLQNSGRLKAESLANKARWINTTRKRQFDEAVAAADIPLVRQLHGQMTAKGQDPGMTLEQAVSGAARNQYLAALPTLDAEQLDKRIDFIRDELGSDNTEFAYDDSGNKIGREDLAKVLHAAKLEQHRRYEEGAATADKLRATGDFTEAKVEELYRTGAINAKQKKAYLGEIRTEHRRHQDETAAAVSERIDSAIDSYSDYADGEDPNDVNDAVLEELDSIAGEISQLRKTDDLRPEQAQKLKNALQKFYAAKAREEKERVREENKRLNDENTMRRYIRRQQIMQMDLRLRDMNFKPGADEYDPQYMGVRQEIMLNDKLTDAERKHLLAELKQKVNGIWSTPDGKAVDQFLKGEFTKKKKNKDGREVREYRGLGYATNWFSGADAIKDQLFQEARYNELRALAGKMLYDGKSPVEVESVIREMAKKLNANELPDKAKAFVIEAVTPQPKSGYAEFLRKSLDDLAVDRKSQAALDSAIAEKRISADGKFELIRYKDGRTYKREITPNADAQ